MEEELLKTPKVMEASLFKESIDRGPETVVDVAEWFEKAFGRKPERDPGYFKQWQRRWQDGPRNHMDGDVRRIFDKMKKEKSGDKSETPKEKEVREWEEKWNKKAELNKKAFEALHQGKQTLISYDEADMAKAQIEDTVTETILEKDYIYDDDEEVMAIRQKLLDDPEMPTRHISENIKLFWKMLDEAGLKQKLLNTIEMDVWDDEDFFADDWDYFVSSLSSLLEQYAGEGSQNWFISSESADYTIRSEDTISIADGSEFVDKVVPHTSSAVYVWEHKFAHPTALGLYVQVFNTDNPNGKSYYCRPVGPATKGQTQIFETPKEKEVREWEEKWMKKALLKKTASIGVTDYVRILDTVLQENEPLRSDAMQYLGETMVVMEILGEPGEEVAFIEQLDQPWAGITVPMEYLQSEKDFFESRNLETGETPKEKETREWEEKWNREAGVIKKSEDKWGWKEELEADVKELEELTQGKVKLVKMSEKAEEYSGSYADIKINNKPYKIWGVDGNLGPELWIEDYPIDNTSDMQSEDGGNYQNGLQGDVEYIADIINKGLNAESLSEKDVREWEEKWNKKADVDANYIFNKYYKFNPLEREELERKVIDWAIKKWELQHFDNEDISNRVSQLSINMQGKKNTEVIGMGKSYFNSYVKLRGKSDITPTSSWEVRWYKKAGIEVEVYHGIGLIQEDDKWVASYNRDMSFSTKEALKEAIDRWLETGEFKTAGVVEQKPGEIYKGKAYRVESNLMVGPDTLKELIDFDADELGNEDIRQQVESLGIDTVKVSAGDTVWVTKTRKDAEHYVFEDMPVIEIDLPSNAVVLAYDDEGGYLVYRGIEPLPKIVKAFKKEALAHKDRIFECMECGKQELLKTNHNNLFHYYCSYCVAYTLHEYIQDVDWTGFLESTWPGLKLRPGAHDWKENPHRQDAEYPQPPQAIGTQESVEEKEVREWEERWFRSAGLNKIARINYYYAKTDEVDDSHNEHYTVFKVNECRGYDGEIKARIKAREMGLELAGGNINSIAPGMREYYTIIDANDITQEQADQELFRQTFEREEAAHQARLHQGQPMVASYDEGDIAEFNIKNRHDDILEFEYIFDDDDEMLEIKDKALKVGQAGNITNTFWKMIEKVGLKDELEKKIETSVYEDDDIYQMDEFFNSLDEELTKLGRGGNTWLIKGEDMGWQGRSGEMEVEITDGRDFYHKVLPRTDMTIHVWEHKFEQPSVMGLYMSVSHHDAPTGESYYCMPTGVEGTASDVFKETKEEKEVREWEERIEKRAGFKIKAMTRTQWLNIAKEKLTTAAIALDNFEDANNYKVMCDSLIEVAKQEVFGDIKYLYGRGRGTGWALEVDGVVITPWNVKYNYAMLFDNINYAIGDVDNQLEKEKIKHPEEQTGETAKEKDVREWEERLEKRSKLKIKPEDITFISNHKSYMMYYKNKPIGGATIMGVGRNTMAHRQEWYDYALGERERILAGQIQEYMLKKIMEIAGGSQGETSEEKDVREWEERWNKRAGHKGISMLKKYGAGHDNKWGEEFKSNTFVIFTQDCAFEMDQLNAKGELKRNMIGKVKSVEDDAIMVEVGKQLYKIPYIEAFNVLEPFQATVITEEQGQGTKQAPGDSKEVAGPVPGEEGYEQAEQPTETAPGAQQGRPVQPRPKIRTDRGESEELRPVPIRGPKKPIEKALEVETVLKDMFHKTASTLRRAEPFIKPESKVVVNIGSKQFKGTVKSDMGNFYSVQLEDGRTLPVAKNLVKEVGGAPVASENGAQSELDLAKETKVDVNIGGKQFSGVIKQELADTYKVEIEGGRILMVPKNMVRRELKPERAMGDPQGQEYITPGKPGKFFVDDDVWVNIPGAYGDVHSRGIIVKVLGNNKYTVRISSGTKDVDGSDLSHADEKGSRGPESVQETLPALIRYSKRGLIPVANDELTKNIFVYAEEVENREWHYGRVLKADNENVTVELLRLGKTDSYPRAKVYYPGTNEDLRRRMEEKVKQWRSEAHDEHGNMVVTAEMLDTDHLVVPNWYDKDHIEAIGGWGKLTDEQYYAFRDYFYENFNADSINDDIGIFFEEWWLAEGKKMKKNVNKESTEEKEVREWEERLAKKSGLTKRAVLDEDQILHSLEEEFEKRRAKGQNVGHVHEFTSVEGRYSSYGHGEAGEFIAGGKTYNWIVDEDKAQEIALDMTEQNYEQNPEMLAHATAYISISDTVRLLVADQEAESMMDRSDEDLVKESGREDEVDTINEQIAQKEDAGKNIVKLEKTKEELIDRIKEELREKYYDEVYEQLSDPVEYFCNIAGIYREEDLVKQPFISLDFKQAAEDDVDDQGWSGVLSIYDGGYEETAEGVVYFVEDESAEPWDAEKDGVHQVTETPQEKEVREWEERWQKHAGFHKKAVWSVWDLQTDTWMSSGQNSATLEEAVDGIIDYLSVDMEPEEEERVKRWSLKKRKEYAESFEFEFREERVPEEYGDTFHEGVHSFSCVECGKMDEQEREIELCDECFKKFDIDELYKLHDASKLEAIDFNENPEMRDMFRKPIDMNAIREKFSKPIDPTTTETIKEKETREWEERWNKRAGLNKKAVAGKFLDEQPEDNEPILYTHFDCWTEDGMEDGDPLDFAGEDDLVDSLKIEWQQITGINFSDLDYGRLGQMDFFQRAGEKFVDAGYDVYDGDNFFEVYDPDNVSQAGGIKESPKEKEVREWEERLAKQASLVKIGEFDQQTLQTSDVPEELIAQIKAIQEDIYPDSLNDVQDEEGWIKDGLQQKFHITILYGVEDKDKKKITEIVKNFAESGLHCKTGDIEYFDNEKDEGDKYTCAVLRIESDGLDKLHKTLKRQVPNDDKYPEYKPHIAIAYLGFKDRLLNAKIEPIEWVIKDIEMTTRKGKLKKISQKVA
jgi:hypothetical protein